MTKATYTSSTSFVFVFVFQYLHFVFLIAFLGRFLTRGVEKHQINPLGFIINGIKKTSPPPPSLPRPSALGLFARFVLGYKSRLAGLVAG
jgi:hypothetical protein